MVVPTSTVIIPTPLPSATLAPYEQFTVDYLRKRTYGGGRIEVLEKLSETGSFSSYSIRYPSDGLDIYGFMNIPTGPGPFPVIVSVHGYAPPGTSYLFDTEADFAGFFAENQIIVIHPGLRNHPPSDNGDNLLRVGMSVDVMNLIALIKDHGNLPAELTTANPELLGLWGTSMGGEIALRILTISPHIKAAVLYSPLSGNNERNSRQLYEFTRDDQFQQDLQVPLEMLDRISPMYFYHRITSAVQIHHGTADTTAPISWAVETCDFLKSAYVPVQCVYYQDAGHLFSREDEENLRRNALEFYKLHLSP
jgi:uncharacterized protein